MEPPLTDNMASRARIEISGKILASDFQMLKKLLPRAIENRAERSKELFPGQPVVILNSNGGDVLAAIRIGRELRRSFAMVIVPEGAVCNSSCIFVLAGGSNRYAFGEDLSLGVHRPFFDSAYFANLSPSEAKKKYDSYAAQVSAFLSEMGASDELYKTMMAVSSGDLRRLSRTEAEAFHLIGDDPAWMEWTRARRIETLGREKVLRDEAHIKCLNEGLGELCKAPK